MTPPDATDDALEPVRRETTASPEAVWAVLADGWTYASWVVGASRVRRVDPAWPAPGARIHHSVGSWPVLLDVETQVLECETGRRLVLQARGRPFGEARVTVEVTAAAGGAVLTMLEDATHGPALLLPRVVRQKAAVLRNAETLQRLAVMAEGRPG